MVMVSEDGIWVFKRASQRSVRRGLVYVCGVCLFVSKGGITSQVDLINKEKVLKTQVDNAECAPVPVKGIRHSAL